MTNKSSQTTGKRVKDASTEDKSELNLPSNTEPQAETGEKSTKKSMRALPCSLERKWQKKGRKFRR